MRPTIADLACCGVKGAVSVWSAAGYIVAGMKPQTDSDEDARAALDRIVDGQMCAEHDGDLEAILAPMADSIVHDVVGSAEGPIRGREAVRHRYQDFLTATIHERDVPIRRLYGRDFVFDEHAWHGRLTGRAFDMDGHGRWISYRVLWLLELREGRIVRQTVWNDLSAIRRQLE
jgi:hypothetical protein